MNGATILRIYDALTTNNACLTVDEIAQASSQQRGTVIEIINRMVRAKLVERRERGCFCLTLDAFERRDDIALLVMTAPTLQDQILRLLQHGSQKSGPMADQLGASRPAVSEAIVRLQSRHLVRSSRWATYSITKQGLELLSQGGAIDSARRDEAARGPHVVKRETLRDRAWSAMRMRGRFTVAEIAALARREENDPKSMIGGYLRALQSAGYVIKQANTSPTRWVLVKNTGPAAPLARRDGTVLDLNRKVAA